MRALITGHRGFIGRHFWQRAVDEGWSAVGIDIADPAHPEDARDFFRRSPFDHGSFPPGAFDLVIHCAAVVGGRTMIEGSPGELLAEDLSIDAELFRWARAARPGRIVYFSSSAAYPTHLQSAPGHRLHEDDIDLDNVASPDLTYGWAKLTGEHLARHAEAEGQRVHVFRPFSGYGEDQALDYPFPSFIDRAARFEDPFTIWGDGTQVRDWIHVDDIVDAVLAAVRYDVPGPVNLGWGEPVAFGELAMLTFEAAGYHPEVDLRLDAPKGVSYRCADASKMLSFYAPRVSLEEGIARALVAHPARAAAA